MKSLRTFLLLCFLLGLSASLSAQRLKKESIQGREAVAGEVIVRFKPSAVISAKTAAAFDAAIKEAKEVGKTGAILLRSDNKTASDLVQTYASRSDVEYVEPNYIWHKSDIPSDPLFGNQWYLQNTGQTVNGIGGGLAGADIHAVAAWSSTIGSHNIVVGVIDTGIDYNHPDLIPNLWSAPFSFTVNVKGQTITCSAGTHGFNAITGSCDPLDDEGHGTFVSGIIGAAGNNGIGISGISRISSILSLKFLDSTGSGTTTDAIEAIEFAIQLKTTMGINVRVLNGSWGSNNFSQALLDEINAANSNDMLFVAAAGNESVNNDTTPSYPANFNAPNLISVAATNNQDIRVSFSNFGAATVHLAAPGSNIESTMRNNTYGFADGTSAAVPMVSGSAALLLAACPLSTSALKSTLLSTVDQVASLAGTTITNGRLNVGQAMSVCTGTTLGSASFNLSADSKLHLIGPSANLSIPIQINPFNGFAGGVHFTASNLPSSISAAFTNDNVAGAGSSTMILTSSSSIFSQSQASIRVTATSGTLSQVINIPLALIPRINQPFTSNLSSSDFHSRNRSGSFSEYYQLALTSPTSVTIDMRSATFDPYLYLLSSDGTNLTEDDNSGSGTSARIGPLTLPAGFYSIEATSLNAGATGDFFIGVNAPTLDSITPPSVGAGNSISVTLKGNRFSSTSTSLSGASLTVTNIVVVDSKTLTATFATSQSTSTGSRNISVVTPEGNSNTVPFAVTPAFPVLNSVSPSGGIAGSTLTLQLTGFGFTPDLTVNAGSGINVSLVSNSDTSASVKFVIDANAPAGNHSVTFTTALGTSNSLNFTVVNQPPVISSISPNSTIAGTSVTVTVSGNNFIAPLTYDAGAGITFSTSSISLNQVTVGFFVNSTAAIGPHTFTITSAVGVSNAVTFTVLPIPVVLNSITPDHVGQGSTLDISLSGSGFIAPMTVDAGPDIVASNVVINSQTSAKVTLAISGSAATGPRNLTLTTTTNTSGPKTLTILLPFPDMTISESRDPNGFGVGFKENYSVIIANTGSVATASPTTMTYDFFSGSTSFVSGSGTGFSCTSTSSLRVVCTHSSSIEPGGQRNLTLTVVSNLTFSTTNFATFTVANVADNDSANDAVSDNTPVRSFPQWTVTTNPSSGGVGIQQTVTLATTGTFPHPLTGTIKLAFASSTTVPADDPSIQFAAGGRQLSVTMAANSAQVLIAGSPSMGFQDGTIAGTLTLSATMQSAGTIQPQSISPVAVTLALLPPAIQNINMDSQSGLAFAITLISDSREMTSVSFLFSPAAGNPLKLSCGSISGCTVSGTIMTFDLQTLFTNWFAADVTYGGAATLRVPFSLDRAFKGTVQVTIRNSRGISQSGSLPIP